MAEALLGFAAVFALASIRIPLAFAMSLVGFGGIVLMQGWNAATSSTAQVVYETGMSYILSVIPLFVLMGNLIARSGLAADLFGAAQAIVGRFRGGLAHATILTCATFGAICGSSIATAATMTKVAYPPMVRLGYSRELASGVITAGGTLGILVPPSTVMVIYGIVTETHIGKLFAAGVLPGVACTLLLMAGVAWTTWRRPQSGPPAEPRDGALGWRTVRGVVGVGVLVATVLGGIYTGAFTTTEGASVGAAGALLIAVVRRSLSPAAFWAVLQESGRTTGMLFALLIGAMVFSNFVNYTTMPSDLVRWITAFDVAPILVVGAMMLVYVVLGSVMEELSMVLLTLPVFFPVVMQLGVDPVWFGILIVLVVQIGLISPPVGMNLFVFKSLAPDVSIGEVFRGAVVPLFALLATMALVMAVPGLATLLPGWVR